MNYLEQLKNDSSNFESFESFEQNFESLLRQGVHPKVAAKAAMKHEMNNMTNAAKSGSLGAAMNQKPFGSGVAKYGAASEFDITVYRATNTVLSGGAPAVLPVPLFGIADLQAGYVNNLNLPAGVTISNIAFSGGKLNISYTDGTHTDIVSISCTQFAYASFLDQMRTNLMIASAIRYTLFDTTAQGLQQFNQLFQVQKRGMFGTVSTDIVNVTAYKEPEQFQQGIIDIGKVNAPLAKEKTIGLDQETSIVIGVNAQATFSFNLSFFVGVFQKHNA
jgi:hypothetical protein